MTRVVCQQLAPEIANFEANVELTTAAVRDAVAAGAQVVVLPELATSGYVFASSDEARAVAVTPSDAVFDRWRDAADNRAVVIGGFCEAGEDGRLYNSAAVVGPDGVLAVYRKTHLWDREKLVFTPGASVPPVVETAVGRIGLVICYDIEFPELPRALALGGADLIVAPVNWPLFPRPAGEGPGEVLLARAAARANHVAVACCDRSGDERGQAWTEGTLIIDADGWVVAAAGAGVASAVADLDLAASRDKRITEHNDLLADRRPDLYGALTEEGARPATA